MLRVRLRLMEAIGAIYIVEASILPDPLILAIYKVEEVAAHAYCPFCLNL